MAEPFLTDKILNSFKPLPSNREAEVILILEDGGRGVGEIQDRMSPRPNNVREVQYYMRTLEQKGFVERFKKPLPGSGDRNNRQINIWRLTPLGKEILGYLKSCKIEKKMVSYLK